MSLESRSIFKNEFRLSPEDVITAIDANKDTDVQARDSEEQGRNTPEGALSSGNSDTKIN